MEREEYSMTQQIELIIKKLIDKYEHNDTPVKELAKELNILAKELDTTIEFIKLSDVNCIRDLLANVLYTSLENERNTA
jgi:hypothetical protein